MSHLPHPLAFLLAHLSTPAARAARAVVPLRWSRATHRTLDARAIKAKYRVVAARSRILRRRLVALMKTRVVMGVRTRLLITLGLVAGFLVLPAVFAAARLNELRDIAQELRVSHADAFLAAGELQADLVELDRQTRTYIIIGDERYRDGMRAALADTRAEWNHLTSALRTAGIRVGKAVWLTALEDAIRHVEVLIESGQREEATTFMESIGGHFAEARAALAVVAHAIDEASNAEVTRARRISSMAARNVMFAVLIALTITLALGLWVNRALTRPLARLRDGMAQVAQGEFEPPSDLPYERSDEIGDLSRSFRSMTHRLSELERLRAELMGVIGHDLKTPLNLISGYAELVEESAQGEIAEEQRQMLSAILDQTRLVTRLVNQLLSLSRFEVGAFDIQFEEVDVRVFFAGLERAFEPMARRRRIRFAVIVEPSTPATIMADVECLYNEVLYNLLSNAFKFTPEGGRVRVRVWGEEQALHVTVSDNGPGIPPEVLPFVFDKFYRAGTHARADGAGLGLALVREVIDAHGGTVYADSRNGRGATFHVVLPVCPAGAAHTAAESDAAGAAGTAGVAVSA